MILKLVRVREGFADKINKHVFEDEKHSYFIGSKKILKHIGSQYNLDLSKCLDLSDLNAHAITIKGHYFYIDNIKKIAIRIIKRSEK